MQPSINTTKMAITCTEPEISLLGKFAQSTMTGKNSIDQNKNDSSSCSVDPYDVTTKKGKCVCSSFRCSEPPEKSTSCCSGTTENGICEHSYSIEQKIKSISTTVFASTRFEYSEGLLSKIRENQTRETACNYSSILCLTKNMSQRPTVMAKFSDKFDMSNFPQQQMQSIQPVGNQLAGNMGGQLIPNQQLQAQPQINQMMGKLTTCPPRKTKVILRPINNAPFSVPQQNMMQMNFKIRTKIKWLYKDIPSCQILVNSKLILQATR